MALGIAAGNPTSSQVFTTEVFESQLIRKLYPSTLAHSIFNHNYTRGLRAEGDSVHISQMNDVQIFEGVAGMSLMPTPVTYTKTSFVVDKLHFYYISMNNQQAQQSKHEGGGLKYFAEQAALQLQIKTDTIALAAIPALVHASNKGNKAGVLTGKLSLGTSGTPEIATRASIYNILARMNTVLSEQNVPTAGRFAVLPPIIMQLLKESEYRISSVTGIAGVSTMVNGLIGQLAGLTLYESNLLKYTAVDDAFDCIFGTSEGGTIFTQLQETVFFDKLENSDGKAIRGSQLWGFGVTQPKFLGTAYLSPLL